MFRFQPLLHAWLVAFALLPLGLVAQPADLAGAGSTTGDPTTGDPGTDIGSPEVSDRPRDLVAALAEWSGAATTLEILIAQDFSDLAAAYIREIEATNGALSDYLSRYEPKTFAAYLSELDASSAATGDQLFQFLVTEGPAYARWQNQLPDSLRLEKWVALGHPEVLLALDRANDSPAGRGVSLKAFLGEQGWLHLWGEAQSMLDKINAFDLPPGSCACALAFNVETSTDQWKEVADWDLYDGAPLPVIDRAYHVDADGPAHDIYFKRRTKAKDLGDARTHDGDAVMTLRLSCFQGDSDEGVPCLSGGCTADLRTKVLYSARTEHLLDGGLGKATVGSANAVRLRYNPGRLSEQLLMSHGIATSGEKRTQWDVAGFFEGTLLSLVSDFIPQFITPEEAAWLENVEEDKATSMVDGVLNIYHIEGTDSSQAYDMKGQSVLDGTMAPNVTYTLKLESSSSVAGWGRLHAHTKTYAWVDSSYLMTAAARNFVCDDHVSPPPRQVWWRYAASPDAPQGVDFLRETIESFALIELNAPLPNQAFAGDSANAGEGSHEP